MLAPISILTNEEEFVTLEDGTVINSITGEILGIAGAPLEPAATPNTKSYEVEMESLAQWAGERITYHRAKVVALEAERGAWLDQINKRFNSDIQRHNNSAEWVTKAYYKPLLDFSRRHLEGAKVRSYKIGLAILKLVKTRAKTTVLDNDKAVLWAAAGGHYSAIKVEISADGKDGQKLAAAAVKLGIKPKATILVSAIPEEVKLGLKPELTGLDYYPGNEEVLKIE